MTLQESGLLSIFSVKGQKYQQHNDVKVDEM